MNNSDSENSMNTRIQELNSRFEALELYYKKESTSIRNELNILKNSIKKDVECGKPSLTSNYYKNISKVALETGVIVRLNNTYKGLYGLVGEVNRFTKSWVWFVDSSGTENKRAPGNGDIVARDVAEKEKVLKRIRVRIVPSKKINDSGKMEIRRIGKMDSPVKLKE